MMKCIHLFQPCLSPSQLTWSLSSNSLNFLFNVHVKTHKCASSQHITFPRPLGTVFAQHKMILLHQDCTNFFFLQAGEVPCMAVPHHQYSTWSLPHSNPRTRPHDQMARQSPANGWDQITWSFTAGDAKCQGGWWGWWDTSLSYQDTSHGIRPIVYKFPYRPQ